MTVTQLGFTFVFPLNLFSFQLCDQLEKSTLVLWDSLLVKVNSFSNSFLGSKHMPSLFTYLYLLRQRDDMIIIKLSEDYFYMYCYFMNQQIMCGHR